MSELKKHPNSVLFEKWGALRFQEPVHMHPKKLHTASEVAAKLRAGITANEIEELAKAGYIPHSTVGKGVPVFFYEDVRDWTEGTIVHHPRTRNMEQLVGFVENGAEDSPQALSFMAKQLSRHLVHEHTCGIYFLCLGDVVVYVGQSAHIPARVMAHTESKTFDRYYTIAVPREDLDMVEGAFIRVLEPSQQGRRGPRDNKTQGVLVAPSPQTRHLDDQIVNHWRNVA